MYDLVVIGGGAAGFFGAICAAEAAQGMQVIILEGGRRPLQKVRISGGGRCNVTHAQFDPRQLVTHYPRGKQELRGPFSKFAPGDTMAWFEDRGVPLKIEEDGRVFPTSDNSESIAGTLLSEAQRLGIELQLSTKVTALQQLGPNDFRITCKEGSSLSAKHVLFATGSSPNSLHLLSQLDIALIDAVPSLFSFNVPDPKLHALKGLSVTDATVTLPASGHHTRGPLLITHWGLSGPAILRASAEAAIELHAADYKTGFSVSWTGETKSATLDYLRIVKSNARAQTLRFNGGLPLAKRLWHYLVEQSGNDVGARWADITKPQLIALAAALAEDEYRLNGQTRFKEEFVTAGGVDLRQLNFRTFELREHPGLYAAGEVLDIDGVTGGFNFQAAWTGGFLAGNAIAESLLNRRSA